MLPAERALSPIDTALDGVIVTAPPFRDPTLVARFDAISGRALGIS